MLTCSGSTRVDRVRIHRDPRVSCGVLPVGVGHVSAARMPPVTHSGAAVRRPGGGADQSERPSASCHGTILQRPQRPLVVLGSGSSHASSGRAERCRGRGGSNLSPMCRKASCIGVPLTATRTARVAVWLSHVCRSAFDAEIVGPDLRLILCVLRCAVVLGFRRVSTSVTAGYFTRTRSEVRVLYRPQPV